ncbi:MAG: Rrf2 family transcriptional regulator [Chloroflexi bacterium]|nr:Rrf2 family transcriptional regulator [Chloroflexota bacterium]MBU1746929.1 Rrf2 family transcriptional regulator [Chloroflexota bacterium]
MELRRGTDYAIRAMAYAARQPAGAVLITDEIASQENIPQSFLRKILPRLASAGLIQTRRGTGGGITLARPPREINLYDIVVAMEGPIGLNRCLQHPGECPREATCVVHDALHQVQQTLIHQLRSTDLDSMVESGPVDRGTERTSS